MVLVMCKEHILSRYLQTFFVETIPHYVFDFEMKFGGCPIQNPVTSFWTITFSTYGSVFLGHFRAATSKAILKKKKNNSPVFVNINLVFY